MSKIRNRSLVFFGAWVAPLFLAGSVFGQSIFTFGVTGPDSLSGNEGASVEADYEATLQNVGGDPVTGGAQGWSFGLQSEGATMLTFTTTGSAADPAAGFFSGGFNKTQVIDPAKNTGKQGGVSAIVLSFTEARVLPVDSTQVVVKARISATMPPVGVGDAFMKFSFRGDLVGAGQPVAFAVTENGETKVPSGVDKIVALRAIQSCCPEDKILNVGFSAGKVSSSVRFDGIVGDGEEGLCGANGGTIAVDVPEGETGATKVYANVISNSRELTADPPGEGGAQGWSFSIAVDGAVNLPSVTTAGTSVDAYYSGGFNKTQVVDPAANGGQRGCVSAIVLSFTEARNLPVVGTESVLEMSIESTAPQGDADIVGAVRFLSGLKGSGQPVANAITVNGATSNACNFETAAASVAFRKLIKTDRTFLRGNPNGDAKVDIADPIWIINMLFRQGPDGGCMAASDANGDGVVDASDAVYLIDYEFRGGSPPVGTFPACDTAPQEDCAADQAAAC